MQVTHVRSHPPVITYMFKLGRIKLAFSTWHDVILTLSTHTKMQRQNNAVTLIVLNDFRASVTSVTGITK